MDYFLLSCSTIFMNTHNERFTKTIFFFCVGVNRIFNITQMHLILIF